MQYNPFSLKEKTILVTGASSGIGRGIAIECSKMGASIVLCGRDEKRLNETLSKLSGGNNHLILTGDLTDPDTIEYISTNCPICDGIVHSAGISQLCMARQLSYVNIDKVFKINVYAPIYLNTMLLKKQKIAKGGSIVIISSISGTYATNIGECGYAATKASLSGYVKGAALDLSSKQIRVNSIHPGVVETPLLDVTKNTFTEEELESLRKMYPLRRFGKPEDIAYSAVYLLSNASSWITGSSLLIDGGYSIK